MITDYTKILANALKLPEDSLLAQGFADILRQQEEKVIKIPLENPVLSVKLVPTPVNNSENNSTVKKRVK